MYLYIGPEVLNESEKQVSMIRKYHNHTLQTNPWRCEEEPQINTNHKTSGRRQGKATNSIFPIKITAKQGGTQSNAQQNMEQTQTRYRMMQHLDCI